MQSTKFHNALFVCISGENSQKEKFEPVVQKTLRLVTRIFFLLFFLYIKKNFIDTKFYHQFLLSPTLDTCLVTC